MDGEAVGGGDADIRGEVGIAAASSGARRRNDSTPAYIPSMRAR